MLRLLFSVSLLLVSGLVGATPPPPCSDSAYQQFDFWLGEWQVTTPNGQVAGTNVITKDLNGCVLREDYKTARGFAGTSANIYDRQTGRWHQTWVDNSGLLLTLNGQFDGKNMVLSGPGKSADGKPLTHRITWTPNDDGTVRQFWQSKSEQQTEWSTVFDGLYTNINSAQTRN